MSTSIHNHNNNPLPKKYGGDGGDGGNDENTSGGDVTATKSSIMKYLHKCGLDTSGVPFSLDDIDDSSMALLVQLSQQYAEGSDDNDGGGGGNGDEGEGEDGGVFNASATATANTINSNSTGPTEAKSNFKMAQQKNAAENEKINESETTAPTTTIAEQEHKQEQKRNTDGGEKIMGVESLSSGMTIAEGTAGLGPGPRPGPGPGLSQTNGVDEVTRILNNTTQRPAVESESREFEQILAQYSLDSKSFAESKMTPRNQNQHENEKEDTNENIHIEQPWAKTLFDKLEKQHEFLSKIQEQNQSVARLVAQDMVERRRFMDILQQSKNDGGNSSGFGDGDGSVVMGRGKRTETGATTTIVNRGLNHLPQMDVPAAAAAAAEEPPLNQQPQQSLLFTLLEGFVTRVFHFPNMFMTYIKSTFIVRVINLIQTDAGAFRRGGALRNGVFLDWTLLIKLIFFSFFLFARFETYDEKLRREMSASSAVGSKKARRELEAFNFWVGQRTVGIICIMVVVYLVQTGTWKFVHHILVKDNVFRRAWKNEDEDSGGANDGIEHNNTPLRRGRRDRQPIHDVDDNVNEDNHDNPNPAEGRDEHHNDAGDNNIVRGPQEQLRGRLQAIVDYFKQQTFLGGHIDRPMNRNNNGNNQPQAPREQILLDRVIDSVKDVLYLFGSFFLSLFPMWHPRPREVVVNDNDQNNDGNDDGDGGNEEPRGHGGN